MGCVAGVMQHLELREDAGLFAMFVFVLGETLD
jgi:hypothetical protein